MQLPEAGETIAALSTAVGKAAVAVIRISGPETRFVLETILGRIPQARMATLASLRDPDSGEVLDRALVLWFPGPRSFSGEDMAEFHIHGGRGVVAAVLEMLTRRPGLRLAEAGEFTRRAFAAGKLDLSAVEGLADLIDAETEAQRRQALRQASGVLSRQVESWRQRLIEAMALVEAGLDFSDEGDVGDDATAHALAVAATVHREIGSHLASPVQGERLRDGFNVVIAGPPNAGKSSLLNALAKRDVAIVSSVPGTTRDLIEVRLDLGGLPVSLIDTAGIRESGDEIEQEGVRRALERAELADLVVWLSPADAPMAPPKEADGGLAVISKADLGKGDLDGFDSLAKRDSLELSISTRTGAGLDQLVEEIRRRASATLGGGEALISRERHRTTLRAIHDILAHVIESDPGGRAPELMAEDMRLALRELGRLTGRVDVEDILGAIFSSFCIGK